MCLTRDPDQSISDAARQLHDLIVMQNLHHDIKFYLLDQSDEIFFNKDSNFSLFL